MKRFVSCAFIGIFSAAIAVMEYILLILLFAYRITIIVRTVGMNFLPVVIVVIYIKL